MAYQPIENYGLIGNMRTAALVSMNGSIDWYCFPHFDSPSVFATILDDRKGGRFQIESTHERVRCKQLYWPDSNVLITRFLCPDGVGEVVDFMPVGEAAKRDRSNQLIRRVRVSRGTMQFRVDCTPAFNYALDRHELHLVQDGAVFRSKNLALGLAIPRSLSALDGGVRGTFELHAGESTVFILRQLDEQCECGCAPTAEESQEMFEQTVQYWRKWLSQCNYHGHCCEMVYRSALTLKLLTFGARSARSTACSQIVRRIGFEFALMPCRMLRYHGILDWKELQTLELRTCVR